MLTYQQAVAALTFRNKIARESWNGEYVVKFKTPAQGNPTVLIKVVNKISTVWDPTQEELDAEDYKIFN